MLTNIFTIHLQWNNNCSVDPDSDVVSVFDGPSTRSPLLGSYGPGQNTSFSSTLFCVTILYISRYIQSQNECMHKHITISKGKAKKETLKLSANEDVIKKTFHFSRHHGNFVKLIKVEVPKSYFVKVRLPRFEYGGFTEAECYLGGVLFSSESQGPMGPFCTSFGSLDLVSEKYDGLTFPSYSIHMLLYLFAETLDMHLQVEVRSDECEGIINPCHRPPNIKSANYRYVRAYEHIILYQSPQPDTCIKIQGFFDNTAYRSCTFVGAQESIGKQVSATSLILATENPTPQLLNRRKCVDSIIKDKIPSNAFMDDVVDEVIGMMSNQYHGDYRHMDEDVQGMVLSQSSHQAQNIVFGLILDHGCPSYLDGAYKVVAKIIEACSSQTLLANTLNSIYGCANLFIPMYQGQGVMYVAMFFDSVQVKVTGQLTIPIYCNSTKHVDHLILSVASEYNNYQSHWQLKDGTLEWEMPVMDEGHFMITLYAAPGAINTIPIQVLFKRITDGFDVSSMHLEEGSVNFSAPNDTCNMRPPMLTLRFNSVHAQKSTLHELVKSDDKVCFLWSCYTVVMGQNISWNRASQLCEEKDQSLLSIKSEFIQEQINQAIFRQNFTFALSPVVFINMKQNVQVT